MKGKKKKFLVGGIVAFVGATAGAIFLSKKKKAKCESTKKEKIEE